MGIDREADAGPRLLPDRYYLLSDAGSFFFDPAATTTGVITIIRFLDDEGAPWD